MLLLPFLSISQVFVRLAEEWKCLFRSLPLCMSARLYFGRLSSTLVAANQLQSEAEPKSWQFIADLKSITVFTHFRMKLLKIISAINVDI